MIRSKTNLAPIATLLPIVALVATLSAPAWAATDGLEVQLEKSRVREGEAVRLAVRQSGSALPVEPDWTPLDADFDVLDARSSTRISVVNGVSDRRHDWVLTLRPRRSGTLTIPALEAGGLRSRPIDLEVMARASAGSEAPAEPEADPEEAARAELRPLFVEMEVDDSEPYVHGSVRLSVRLHAAESILEGGLSDPRIEGALVRRMGEDRQSVREVDGHPYRVVEREYAVAPQRSGTLRIEPVVFEGLVRDETADPRARRPRGSLLDQLFGSGRLPDPFADAFLADAFGDTMGGSLLSRLSGSTRPVRAASAPLELAVRPRPDTATGAWWLPARRVELLESWESEPPLFRVGEPVRRHVILRADGLAADQLPPLAIPEPDGLSQYREPAKDDTRVNEAGLQAQRAVETVLIPTRAGELELPAVEVSWWDTTADRARTARLPARSIQVLPGTDAPQLTASAGPPAPRADVEARAEVEPRGARGAWIVPAAAAALLLVAFGSAGFALRRRRAAGAPPAASRRRAERDLARACRRGDAAAADAACRLLARLEGEPASLADRAERGGQAELAAALGELYRVRYADDKRRAERWDGRALWRAWRASRPGWRRRGSVAEAPVLPALYPES